MSPPAPGHQLHTALSCLSPPAHCLTILRRIHQPLRPSTQSTPPLRTLTAHPPMTRTCPPHSPPPALQPPTPPPPPSPPDLLTGFHLVDGMRRIILLEGLCDGAMRMIRVGVLAIIILLEGLCNGQGACGHCWT